MGIAPATYGAHERAESDGGRDYGPEEAQRYGLFLHVSAEWLLTGDGDPSQSNYELKPAPHDRYAALGEKAPNRDATIKRIRSIQQSIAKDLKVLDTIIDKLKTQRPQATLSKRELGQMDFFATIFERTQQRLHSQLRILKGLTRRK